MRAFTGMLIVAVLSSLWMPTHATAGIEAVKGKQYHLTKKHGPWMVMVAVFSEPPEEMKGEGLTPEQAADELIYELRSKGIPAYSYQRDQKIESIETMNRLQQTEKRSYKLDKEICILAGNYKAPEADDQLAKRTLAWLKEYRPKSLEKGGIYKPTPGQPSLLSGAFLTINPLLDPAAVKRQQKNPELVRYNSHFENSLLENPGKFTVRVAAFYPNSVTQIGDSQQSSRDKLKDEGHFEKAASQAWQVMRALREQGVEAYVYHDHRSSIVTVGAFNDLQDPGIEKIQQDFSAEVKMHPQTGQQQLIGKFLVLPSQEGQWMCTFEPQPEVVPVPFK